MAIQDTDTFLVARGTANYQVAGSVLKAYAGGSGSQAAIPDVTGATYGNTGLSALYGAAYDPVNGYYQVITNTINGETTASGSTSILVSTDGTNFNLASNGPQTVNPTYYSLPAVVSLSNVGGFVYGRSYSGGTGINPYYFSPSKVPPEVASRLPYQYLGVAGVPNTQYGSFTSSPAYYEAGNVVSLITFINNNNPTTSRTFYSLTSTDGGASYAQNTLFTSTDLSGDSPVSYSPRGYESAYLFMTRNLYKTTDGGYTFNKISTPLPGAQNNSRGTVGAVGTGNMVTVSNPVGGQTMYYSTNDGLTWNTSSGLPSANVNLILYSDLADKFIVFTSPYSSSGTGAVVSGGGACYVSTDGTGASFRLAAPGNQWLQAALGYIFDTYATIGFGTPLYFLAPTTASSNRYLCQVDPTTL